jgi:DNA repair protein SbcC/Rad50
LNNPGFFIKSVNIINFRGYISQTFTFFRDNESKRGLILLGGPNGYGKTSLLDAMEWCLTGNIKRLENDFMSRKESSKPTKEIQRGMIRNNPKNKNVSVTLEIEYQKKEYVVERLFNDLNEVKAFDPRNSIFKINGEQIIENPTIDYILDKSISRDFYDRYTCSYEKNIKVYEKSRSDIYELFSSFFGGTDEIEKLIANIEGFSIKDGKRNKSISGILSNLGNEIEAYKIKRDSVKENMDEELNKYKELLNKQQNNLTFDVISRYPISKYYLGEKNVNEIFQDESLNEEKISSFTKQRQILQNLFYLRKSQQGYKLSKEHIKNLDNILRFDNFQENLLIPFIENSTLVKKIQGKSLDSVQREAKEKRVIKNSIENIKSINRENYKKLLTYSVEILNEENEFYKDFINLEKSLDKLSYLNGQLKAFDNSDEVVIALRSLIDQTESFKKLQEVTNECPLCGSAEKFTSADTDLGLNAREILGKVDEERAAVQNEFNELSNFLKKTFKEYHQMILEKLDEKISLLEEYNLIFSKTEKIRIACSIFNISFDNITRELLEEISLELMSKVANVTNIEDEILNSLMNNSGYIEGIKSYFNSEQAIQRNEFFSLNNQQKKESLLQFVESYEAKLSVNETELGEVINLANISTEELQLKINTLKFIEDNLSKDKSLEDLNTRIQSYEKDLKKLDKTIFSKNQQILFMKKILNDLKHKRDEWDKEVAKQIQKPLQTIYRRLNRHTNVQGISLVKEGRVAQKAKITASINENEINASNVLSAGQLSILALSVFFTVAMGQKMDRFKCYFLDDPVQTMDDLNVLSFIDLLRTELGNSNDRNERFADQMFLTTCDEDFEKLINHKMRNFDVNFQHIQFINYGKYIEV